MSNEEKTFEELLEESKSMTSEERIEKMFVDNTMDQLLLNTEVSYRTGIDWETVDTVLVYMLEHDRDVIVFEEVVKEIKAETGVDEETAFKILECEDDIMWELGLCVPVDEDDQGE